MEGENYWENSINKLNKFAYKKNGFMKLYLFVFCVVACQMFFAQTGIIKSFYPDGMLRSEISYVNDILDGTALLYHPNGNLSQEKIFSKGIIHGWVREYYDSGLLKEEFYIDRGIKDGTHKIYFENGGLKSIEVFEAGKLVSRNQFKYDPLYKPSIEAFQEGNRQVEVLRRKRSNLICEIDVCPLPIGGMKSIQDILVYPEHALLYGIEGTVLIIAIISETGDVKETKILKGLGLGCDEAADAAVKQTKFLPGQEKGKVVEASVTLNIEFKILDRSLIKNDSKEELKLVISNSAKNTQNEFDRRNFRIECKEQFCPVVIGGYELVYKNLEVLSIARRLKLKGIFEIEGEIDANGFMTDARVLKGLGYGMDEAAVSALMKSKYIPAKKEGNDVPSKVLIYMPFNYEELN
jgi:TonB family protein